MAAGYRKRADVQQKELLKGLRESPKGATGGCPVVSSFWWPLPATYLPLGVGDKSSCTPPAALLIVAPPGSPEKEASLQETRHLAVPARTPNTV